MQGLRTANGSKKFVDFLVFDKPIIDKEAEIFVLQNEKFIGFCDETSLNDQSRFDAFADTIDGPVKDLFNVIRNDGTRWYDPAHQDADTNEGFVRMLQALFVWAVDNRCTLSAPMQVESSTMFPCEPTTFGRMKLMPMLQV